MSSVTGRLFTGNLPVQSSGTSRDTVNTGRKARNVMTRMMCENYTQTRERKAQEFLVFFVIANETNVGLQLNCQERNHRNQIIDAQMIEN